ncbi:MAG: flagellar motor switch protein FliN [Acidobacteria bacterium]|nr:flagellar motor switch protein FliN [Acidobacteriota bacterium]
MDPLPPDLQKKLGQCFSESMASVFSMLTGREFTLSPGAFTTLDTPGVAALHEGTTILVKAHYTKGLSGPLIFALHLREGTRLVDLMLGGEGAPADELVGDSRDALAETFNQVMGSANQTLSDQAGETISISNVEILAVESEAKGLEELLGPPPFHAVPLEAKQDGLSAVVHALFPDLLVQQLKRKLGFQESSPAPLPEASRAETSRAAAGAPPAQRTPAAGPATITVDAGNLDLIMDIELQVVVRMGQTEMPLGELLKLTPGAIIELNRAADAPVDLLVNGKQIARGEVVVVDGNFAFRITEIESTAARIRSLG